jgi:hypothetical protein
MFARLGLPERDLREAGHDHGDRLSTYQEPQRDQAGCSASETLARAEWVTWTPGEGDGYARGTAALFCAVLQVRSRTT